ncbi:MAG: hypothetical protein AB7F31_06965 [Parachlamydiales bacterium]
MAPQNPSKQEEKKVDHRPQQVIVTKITDNQRALEWLKKGITPEAIQKLEADELVCVATFASAQQMTTLLHEAEGKFPLWDPLLRGLEANGSIDKTARPNALNGHLKQNGKGYEFRHQLIHCGSRAVVEVLWFNEQAKELVGQIQGLKDQLPQLRAERMASLFRYADQKQGEVITACANKPVQQLDLLVGTAVLARSGDTDWKATLSTLRNQLATIEANIIQQLAIGDMVALYFGQKETRIAETYKKELVRRLGTWAQSECSSSNYPFKMERSPELELKPDQLDHLVKLKPTAPVMGKLVLWYATKHKAAEARGALEGFNGTPFAQIPDWPTIISAFRNSNNWDWWIGEKEKVAAALRSSIDQPKGLSGVTPEQQLGLADFFDQMKESRPTALVSIVVPKKH